MAGSGGVGGMAGMGGSGGCPAGALSSESVDLKVSIGPVTVYEDVAAGLQVTPGLGSGNLYGSPTIGMGTDAIGNVRSIQSGDPNESIVLEIFRSDGSSLGAPEGALDVVLTVSGLPTTTEFDLFAEDKDGNNLGSATARTGDSPVDVSGLISGAIHKLTIEATTNSVSILGVSYTHLCLGYTAP
ncbi:MAG: hypothetical protein JRD92_13455, partial [Deltaproteobacteria bacterium]|nr:hypothetical protein [Deltaproteobacteria bacterium]